MNRELSAGVGRLLREVGFCADRDTMTVLINIMRELIVLSEGNLDPVSLYDAWKGRSLEIPESPPEAP